MHGVQSRRTTRQVRVGGIAVGGAAPIVVQSMTNTDTADIKATVAQVAALARAGSELVRVTVNTAEAAAAVPHIREQLAASALHKPGEHWVKLKFEREAWVEIRDRNGRKIFSRLNPAGTEQAVSGQPPLTLVVGNAAGVRVTHNDQWVDLAPYVKIDVARLTLE